LSTIPATAAQKRHADNGGLRISAQRRRPPALTALGDGFHETGKI
jgi:hypothetical protein